MCRSQCDEGHGSRGDRSVLRGFPVSRFARYAACRHAGGTETIINPLPLRNIMAGVFHWVKVRLFCHATEDEDMLRGIMARMIGTDDMDAEVSEGHHGNMMIILSADLKGDRECRGLFGVLGKDVICGILDGLEERIDEDCTFRLRLDKQAAVLERYEIAHHGDVISVTCKIVSHPARKEIAEKNMRAFLGELLL